MTGLRPASRGGDGCLPAVLLVVSIVPLSVIHAVTFMKLWEWFVADPFGVRELGLPLAIGLTSLVSAVTIHPSMQDKDPDAGPWEVLVKVWIWRVCITALLLAEGLIVSRWV